MTLTHAHIKPHKPARAVVLGASGFLGKRLMRACAAAGVTALGLGSRDLALDAPAAEQRLAEQLQPQDVIILLAALTPDRGRDLGTLMRNLAICRAVSAAILHSEVAQLIYASSDAVYSFSNTLVAEDTPAIPVDLYGAMHRMRELILAVETKVPLAVLRFTAVYGPGDTHNSYGPNRFVRDALKDGRIALFGEGEETRDHLYIDDAVDLVLAVMAHGSTGLLNVASGKSHSFRAVAECVAGQAGRSIGIDTSPRRNPVTHRHFDNINLLRAFPGVRFRSLSDGLKTTLAEIGSDHA